MANRTSHQAEVYSFLVKKFNTRNWEFNLPRGWGKETYFVRSREQAYFIKLGVSLANYQVTASLGLTPPVLATGMLEDGISILVQTYIQGRVPSWIDFRVYMDQIAEVVIKMQTSPMLRRALPPPPTQNHRELGILELVSLRQKWAFYKPQVPQLAEWVDTSLDNLAKQINFLESTGVVVAHNDICNANWLITSERKVYLIDLDAMSLDDPAVDLAALLWWYYPPQIRGDFLKLVGYQDDESLRKRMRLRMAMHCLSILLPREGSFDRFDTHQFTNSLADFRAILAGEENPHGYEDV
jgi:hypothetical protein